VLKTNVGCTEEISLEDAVQSEINVENLLVVEATLTNEVKNQKVLLSRANQFSNGENVPVENAVVNVTNDLGEIFPFTLVTPGTFLSVEAFSAIRGISYQLNIEIDGKVYQSTSQSIVNTSKITSLYAERTMNDTGQEGIGIFVDAEVDNTELPFLRFNFEETYKIIAPLWSPFDLVVDDPNPPYAFTLVPREKEERICFATQNSNRILLSDGQSISSGKLKRIPVRFIPKEDPIIAHRYSILVRQFAQNQDAFSFYGTLDGQSTSANVFSEVQPGFVEGNIYNIAKDDELVIGFFEVVDQASERLFFNYVDFFPDEPLPPYFINCNFLGAPITINPAGDSPLKDAIESGDVVFIRRNFGEVPEGGPYLTAPRPCGDCTALGSNVEPDFWEE